MCSTAVDVSRAKLKLALVQVSAFLLEHNIPVFVMGVRFK